jgi:hypothetical protein
MGRYAWLYWMLPLLAHSADAHAWGLVTHVYFSQLLVWAVPLLDPRLRDAARSFPRLVLAGACLPDLALFGRSARTAAFEHSHEWARAAALLEGAGTAQERAVALGYASHLFVDVIAHNHFVPAHEHMWLRLPMLTHAVAEWVMDAHVAPHLFARPHALLAAERATLAAYVVEHFDCGAGEARRALDHLGRATALLYGSGLPPLLAGGARLLDGDTRGRCEYYAMETARRLPEINRLLTGEAPNWRADLPCPERTGHLKRLSCDELRGPLPLPASLFG